MLQHDPVRRIADFSPDCFSSKHKIFRALFGLCAQLCSIKPHCCVFIGEFVSRKFFSEFYRETAGFVELIEHLERRCKFDNSKNLKTNKKPGRTKDSEKIFKRNLRIP